MGPQRSMCTNSKIDVARWVAWWGKGSRCCLPWRQATHGVLGVARWGISRFRKAKPKSKFGRFHPRKKHVVSPFNRQSQTFNIEKTCKNYLSKMHVRNNSDKEIFVDPIWLESSNTGFIFLSLHYYLCSIDCMLLQLLWRRIARIQFKVSCFQHAVYGSTVVEYMNVSV